MDLSALSQILITTGVFVGVVALIISVVIYLLKSIGIYKIAQAQGTSHAKLAFVPLINTCYLGVVADEINTKKGKQAYTKMFIIISTIISVVMLVFVIIFSIIVKSISSNMAVMGIVLALLLSLFKGLLSLSALVAKVFCYIATYIIFDEYSADNKILFTVLSIIFSLEWLFLFIVGTSISKKQDFSPQRNDDISSFNL